MQQSKKFCAHSKHILHALTRKAEWNSFVALTALWLFFHENLQQKQIKLVRN